MTDPSAAALVAALERHLVAAFGPVGARAAVTFLGTDELQVLRFGPDDAGVRRYVTVGASTAPMADPAALHPDPVAGPRVELVLALRGSVDEVLRPLAALARTPVVEGLRLTPGMTIDLGGPLWDGADVSTVLLDSDAGLADLPLAAPADPIRFLAVLPLLPEEVAARRRHGTADLRASWQRHGTDLTDPRRRFRADASLTAG